MRDVTRLENETDDKANYVSPFPFLVFVPVVLVLPALCHTRRWSSELQLCLFARFVRPIMSSRLLDGLNVEVYQLQLQRPRWLLRGRNVCVLLRRPLDHADPIHRYRSDHEALLEISGRCSISARRVIRWERRPSRPHSNLTHVASDPEALSVTLDTRPLKTTTGKPLDVPVSKPLVASLIAHEWDCQDTIIKPHALPVVCPFAFVLV